MNRSEAGKLGYIAAQPKIEVLMQKRIEEYSLAPILCRHCLSPLLYEQRYNCFCNHTCAAIFNNHHKPRKKCKDCKINLRYKTGCWFCEECHNRRKQEWGNPRLGKGSYKKLLVRDRGRKCENCKNALWMEKPIPLETHHVDGNSDNWGKENLQLLCPNCHALTPNYKFRNVGAKGTRQVRRLKRYREGKTY